MSIVYVDDKNFKQEVLDAPLAVLADFFAEWCGPCKRVTPILEELAKEYEGKIKVAKVDVDKAGQTASKYGIMSVPTIMFFKNGKAVSQNVGAMSKFELKNKILEVLGG